MKRSFVPAGFFVLVLLVVAVSLKYYVKYEYQSTMDQFLRAEAVYTVVDCQTEDAYPLNDPESRVALAGFLQNTLVLDRSANGSPKDSPHGTDAFSVQAEGGATLVVSRSDPARCYLEGRFFTHYFTNGQAVAEYLTGLTKNLKAA